jgi:hypothetical protein
MALWMLISKLLFSKRISPSGLCIYLLYFSFIVDSGSFASQLFLSFIIILKSWMFGFSIFRETV